MPGGGLFVGLDDLLRAGGAPGDCSIAMPNPVRGHMWKHHYRYYFTGRPLRLYGSTVGRLAAVLEKIESGS